MLSHIIKDTYTYIHVYIHIEYIYISHTSYAARCALCTIFSFSNI